MQPNYQGNKKRKEEQRRKKQEAKRMKRLNKGGESNSPATEATGEAPFSAN